MSTYLFDQARARKDLKTFFKSQKASLDSFGSKVNQTFEAHVFAEVIKWFRKNKWDVTIVNPKRKGKEVFVLKFNTRGAPKGYSYAVCTKGSEECQIRHGLRVHTKSFKHTNTRSANIVCDIVVMANLDIEHFDTNDAISNEDLISFGEVKHMSAFAELIASFIGLVHELQPSRLRKRRKKKVHISNHIASFLYVSGLLQPTAQGIIETIKQRGFDIDVYSHADKMNS